MIKAIVTYDELGNPIAVQEVREFKEGSLPSFEALCEGNKRKYEGRLAKLEEERKAEETRKSALEKRRSAWIARLLVEWLMDKGDVEMDEKSYEAFVENFNLGDVKDFGKMPLEFKGLYLKLIGGEEE